MLSLVGARTQPMTTSKQYSWAFECVIASHSWTSIKFMLHFYSQEFTAWYMTILWITEKKRMKKTLTKRTDRRDVCLWSCFLFFLLSLSRRSCASVETVAATEFQMMVNYRVMLLFFFSWHIHSTNRCGDRIRCVLIQFDFVVGHFMLNVIQVTFNGLLCYHRKALKQLR